MKNCNKSQETPYTRNSIRQTFGPIEERERSRSASNWRLAYRITMRLAIAILLVGTLTNAALASDSLNVTRSDGTLDAFAVVPCPYCSPGTLTLRHTAIASYGAGTVYSNDDVGIVGSTCNLINAFWVYSNTNGPHNELHVRAYISSLNVVEWIWGFNNTNGWSGPFSLK